MQARITFNRAQDPEDRDFIYLFLDVALERIDDVLFRKPDYVVRGRHKITVTFYGLSRREAETIRDEIRPEIYEDGLVDRVTVMNSQIEEDPGPYQFIPTEYKEGVKEDLESKKGYGLDIRKIVLSVMRSTAQVLYEEYEDTSTPITTTAFILGYISGVFAPDDEEYFRDWLDEKIANEPMYKERKRRRRPRGREYSDKNILLSF